MTSQKLIQAKIINYSGFYPIKISRLPVLKHKNYVINDEISIAGDRPKDFYESMNTIEQ